MVGLLIANIMLSLDIAPAKDMVRAMNQGNSQTRLLGDRCWLSLFPGLKCFYIPIEAINRDLGGGRFFPRILQLGQGKVLTVGNDNLVKRL